MGEETGISWTDHTFNPWWGCVRVSEACRNCYAERTGNRFGVTWGVDTFRRFFDDKHWNQPAIWNRKALAAGVRRRVFCASMADVFEDRRDLDEHRTRLWSLIKATPALDWLLLTKRPEHFAAMLPWSSARPCEMMTGGRTPEEAEPCGVTPTTAYNGRYRYCATHTDRVQRAGATTLVHGSIPWPNVWLGVTAEDAERAEERIPILRATPAVCRFVSCEPILEHIGGDTWDIVLGERPDMGAIDWLIVGDESGPGARPAEVEWVRTAHRAAQRHGAAFHFKQWAGADQPGIAHNLGTPAERKGRKIHLPILDGKRYGEFPSIE